MAIKLPKALVDGLKSEIKSEIIEELGKTRLDNADIDFISSHIISKINIPEPSPNEIAQILLSQIKSTEEEKRVDFYRQEIFTSEIRTDLINKVLEQVEIPEPVKGDAGEKGDDGPGYTLTDKDKKEIASLVDLTPFDKEINRAFARYTERLKKGDIRIPRGAGIDINEIIAEFNKVLGSTLWQGPSETQALQQSYDNSDTQPQIIISDTFGSFDISDENDTGLDASRFGKVSAGDYTKFEFDGTLESLGEAACWDDISNAIIAARLDVSAGRLDYDYFNGGVIFQANARYPDEPVVIPVQFKHAQKYGAGAVLRPHFHWLQQQSAVPNFLLGYKKINWGTATTFETDFSNYTLSAWTANGFTYPGSGTYAQITKFPEIDVSDVTISGAVQFVLFRDNTNASGLFPGADPVATATTVIYQDQHGLFNMFGSREEFDK